MQTSQPTKDRISLQGEDTESANRGFRIRKSLLDALQKEARDRNVTVNSIVDESLAKHAFSYRVFGKYHPILEEATIMKLLCEAIPEDKIVKIGEELASDILSRDLSADITGNESAESCLQAIRIWALETGNCEFSEEDYGDKQVIILGDHAGKNWFLLMGTYWKTVLRNKGLEVEISTTDNAAVIRFRKSDLARLGV